MARSGLRMMPTFPLPSLKFRTAGFPQYGFKAGVSDRACPFDAACTSLGLPPPFVLPAARVGSPFCAGGRCALKHLRSSGRCRSNPRGPRSRPGYAVPLHPHLRPHPPHSQAHPDFTAPRLIRNAFAVHTAPRRPPSGSTLSRSFLPDMPPSTTPGRSETGWFQSCGPDIGLRHVMSGSALPTILLSASRRADFSELHWFAFAAACQVARPLCRSDQNSSGHRDFYFQASDESVTLLAAGYNYDSHWTVLSMGLSPIGVTTSVAAP
jgi:hypothetical protein